jgi:hypothetical protein
MEGVATGNKCLRKTACEKFHYLAAFAQISVSLGAVGRSEGVKTPRN